MTDWPILVLTLPGDDERRAPLLQALTLAGLPYALFWGVDGRRGLPAEFEPIVDRARARERIGRPMTDGELACALSHRAIYQHIVDNGLSGAVVLEDDAKLQPDFPDFIRAGEYRGAPMVLIDYAFGRATRLRRRVLRHGVLRRAAVPATVTTAYAVDRVTAGRLLDHATPVSHPADWPADLYELGAWLLVPRLVRHDPPGARLSHLDADRGVAVAKPPRKPQGIRALIRRKLSVRVDRFKGKR